MKRRRPTVDMVELGRHLAAVQGVADARSDTDWHAYGQACQDALLSGRPLPTLRDPAAPRAPLTLLEDAPAPPLRRHLGVRLVAGLAWRYGVLVAVLMVGEADAGVPWLPLFGLLAAGVLLGLWHRRWLLARLWRTTVVACAAVFVAPFFPSLYPDVIVGSLGALTAAPVIATWHRRNRRWTP